MGTFSRTVWDCGIVHAHIEDTGGGNIFLWIIERHNIYVILIQLGRGLYCMLYGLPVGFGKAVLSVHSATHAQCPYKFTILLIFYTIIFKNTPNYLQ